MIQLPETVIYSPIAKRLKMQVGCSNFLPFHPISSIFTPTNANAIINKLIRLDIMTIVIANILNNFGIACLEAGLNKGIAIFITQPIFYHLFQ